MMMKGSSNRPWKALMGNLLLMLSCLFMAAAASATDRTIYYHTDFLGSVVAATDESGALLWRESYRPFGERIDREVSTKENTPFYTGKPHDDDTGLSYFGARDYDPMVGRFLGIDPVGVDPANLHSFNRYAYANNNPYKYVDPDGRAPIIIPIAIFVAKELAGEVFEQTTGLPAPTVKGIGKRTLKKGGDAFFSDAPKRGRKFWTNSTTFQGNKVYQRNDLIDPKLVDARGRSNLDRMQKGLAPIGPDGKSMNLHHMTQGQRGGIAEMTQTFHQQNSRTIHINPNSTPSGIDRGAFNKWRSDYWKSRANDF